MAYTVSDIAKILGGSVFFRSPKDASIRTILIDSRARETANAACILFFAIKGERNNGHHFIEELYERGIRNFVVSEDPPGIEANFIRVENTSLALQMLAAHHRALFNYTVIGITGSNGKTIVKEWLHQLLSPDKKIVRSPRSYNSQVGVPLSVWQMQQEHNLAIFEAGISKIGEMSSLEKIIQPAIGLITNIGSAHDAGFGNSGEKIQEKLRLFKNSKTLFYCRDNELLDSYIDRLPESLEKICWSVSKEADLKINAIEKSGNQTRLHAVLKSPLNNNQEKKAIRGAELCIPFIDDASVENAIHCWLLMLYFGYSDREISRRMGMLSPIAMRLEQKEGINHCTIINDSYNSDTGSLSIALDFLNQQNQHNKKTLILSDILQSGKEDDKLYAVVADLVNNKGIGRIIGIGKAISLHFNLFDIPEKKFFFNTEAFLEEFNDFKFENESVLLKGARIFGFERINSLLQKKSHETVLEIHLNSLVHNLNFFRSRMKPSTKIMAMVKAFSYGSGSHEIANLLQFHRVDYLAVAFTDEGVELRNAGITLPIMVMNPEVQSFDSLLKYCLEPEIYSFRLLRQISEFIQKSTIRESFPVHLKIDTGMHRLGFEPDQIGELVSAMQAMPHLQIKSVFSHLAAADDPSEDQFTQMQIDRYKAARKKISESLGGNSKFFSHIANSSGALRFPQAQLDMVRIGIGLYGVAADAQIQKELHNVTVLKTIISQIKKVEKGESIGYNRGKVAEENMVIATVPIGYADGYSRRLGNGKGKMIVNGKKGSFVVSVTGNICMDMCMVDISGIDAEEGDEVIVFGSQYPISEIARDAGTIPYEILTGISRRVKRVYFQE